MLECIEYGSEGEQSRLVARLQDETFETLHQMRATMATSNTEIFRRGLSIYDQALQLEFGADAYHPVRGLRRGAPLPLPPRQVLDRVGLNVAEIDISDEYAAALETITLIEGREGEDIVEDSIMYLGQIAQAYQDGYRWLLSNKMHKRAPYVSLRSLFRPNRQ